MQQTEKYQFNLIEGGDDFSPNPLNENMEKVEAQLGAVAEQFGAVDKAMAAVAANLGAVGKNARIAWGSYTGNGKYGSGNPNSLTFEFVPVLIILRSNGGVYTASYVRPCPTGGCATVGSYGSTVTWSDHGLRWYNEDSPDYQNNCDGYLYYYVAIGYDE